MFLTRMAPKTSRPCPEQDSPNTHWPMFGLGSQNLFPLVTGWRFPDNKRDSTQPNHKDGQFRVCIHCCQEPWLGPSLETCRNFSYLRLLLNYIDPLFLVISLCTVPLCSLPNSIQAHLSPVLFMATLLLISCLLFRLVVVISNLSCGGN